MKPIEVSAVSWKAGRLDLFGIGSPSNNLSHKYFDGDFWHNWESLGGIIVSAPVVVSRDQNRLDLFALGTDSRMYHKWWAGGWGPGTYEWDPMWDQKFISEPAAVSWGSNRIDVFGLGSEHNVLHAFWDGSTWHPWQDLGGVGTFTGPPAVGSWASGRLDVFAVTEVGVVYHIFFDGKQWGPDSGWESIGGNISGTLAVVSPAPNDLQIYGIGAANKDMLNKGWNGTTWQPSLTEWTSLGGVFDSPPAVASFGPYGTGVFGLGTDDQMYLHSPESGAGWEALGGVFRSAPAAVSWGLDRWDVFGLGTDQQMYHKYWTPFTGWQPPQGDWEALGGVFDPPLVGA